MANKSYTQRKVNFLGGTAAWNQNGLFSHKVSNQSLTSTVLIPHSMQTRRMSQLSHIGLET